MDSFQRLQTTATRRIALLTGVLVLVGGIVAQPAQIPHNQFNGRFRVDRQGLVVDEVRRLTWRRCSYGQVYNGITCAGRPRALSLLKARAYCAGLSTSGRVWRLPVLNELESLADPNRTVGAKIDPRWFPATDPYGYWTRSFFSDPTGLFWSVFHFGEARHFGAREGRYLVRCVSEWFGE